MQITIPENIKDIKLGQYQHYLKLIERTDLTDEELLKRKVSIFTELSYKNCNSISIKDLLDLSLSIDKALSIDVDFESTFSIGETEFGFVPNFDKITSAEWFDLRGYDNDTDMLHKVFSILFRPIKKRDSFGNYSIKKYKGTDRYCEIMKQTPLSIVNGALGFFLTLQNELYLHTLRYIPEEQVKA